MMEAMEPKTNEYWQKMLDQISEQIKESKQQENVDE